MNSLLPLAEIVAPNLHVAVVHFPIALLAMGLACEVVAGLCRAASLRSAARWMILLGAMSALPVALSGLYAIRDLASAGGESMGAWRDVMESSRITPEQWTALLWHARLQGAATIAALLASVWFLACSDVARRVLYLPLLAVVTLSVLATVAGAHVAGEAVYRQGLGEVSRAATTPPPASLPGDWDGRAAYIFPPLQLHLLIAGAAISLGLVSLAAALRNTTLLGAPPPTKILVPGASRYTPTAPPPLLPASRLLLLTALVGLAAAAMGTWYLSRESQTRDPAALWSMAMPFPPRDVLAEANREELRRPAHIVAGSTLVLVPLVMAVWVRFRPRGRLVLSAASVIFLAAAAGQAYVGGLLLLDTPMGPLTRLQGDPPPAPPTTTSPATGATGSDAP